ncbi:hypothetical protein V5799_021368 [Amblyomma americanum]|uniref:Uncharacterized protein n=1 Tax=Amblyomma americanum TaxID=6943 RepID=A0AAQ4FQ02_AMBAM
MGAALSGLFSTATFQTDEEIAAMLEENDDDLSESDKEDDRASPLPTSGHDTSKDEDEPEPDIVTLPKKQKKSCWKPGT